MTPYQCSFILCCIKIYSSHTFASSFACVWYNAMHWLFRQCWFNELCISSQCWHLLFYNIKKITFVNITTDLTRKVFKYWESVGFMWCIQVFQDYHFCLTVCILSVAINTVSSFLWSDGLISLILGNVCQNSKFE